VFATWVPWQWSSMLRPLLYPTYFFIAPPTEPTS
jgi:hypothetical protein